MTKQTKKSLPKKSEKIEIRVSRLAFFLAFANYTLRNSSDYGTKRELKEWLKEGELLLKTLKPFENDFLIVKEKKEKCDLCYLGNCTHKCHSKGRNI